MEFSKQQVFPGVWVDSRRAVFLDEHQILAISDLHLGYAWAHRFRGQLLPLQADDDWAGRLAALCETYEPRKLAVLGDIIHQAVPVPELREEFQRLTERFCPRTELLLVLGNHDRQLPALAPGMKFHPELRAGDFLLTHGDTIHSGEAASLTIMGHEHPAFLLGDGVATAAKFPCFLVSRAVLVLPAFSTWAAGTVYGSHPLLSPLARDADFHQAIVIMGHRLLPMPLSRQHASVAH